MRPLPAPLSVTACRLPGSKRDRGTKNRSPLRLCAILALVSLTLCSVLVLQAERRLGGALGGVLQRGEGLGESRSVRSRESQPRPTGGGARQFQRIQERAGRIFTEYGCLNFNNDPVRVSYAISSNDLASYKQGYGFTQGELDALSQWQKKALNDAYQYAVRNRLNQEELNRLAATVKSEYKSKYRSLLTSRSFAILPDHVLVADLPSVARRNVKALRPFAQALSRRVDKRESDSDEIIGAALSLVQTAFLYENVPLLINGRQTGGIYPPLETVARGKGDCDTKSVLLGAILLNWSKMKLVGVGVPDHYLMGVLRNPAKGDLFVEYEGLPYVLMEPAGPAWLPPGAVGPVSTALLKSGAVAIEPFKLN